MFRHDTKTKASLGQKEKNVNLLMGTPLLNSKSMFLGCFLKKKKKKKGSRIKESTKMIRFLPNTNVPRLDYDSQSCVQVVFALSEQHTCVLDV